MKAVVISKVIKYGNQHWRLNADGSWSGLAFGSFGPQDNGLRYGWIDVPNDKVPDEVRQAIK